MPNAADEMQHWKNLRQLPKFQAMMGAFRLILASLALGCVAAPGPGAAQDLSVSTKSRANQLAHRLSVLDGLQSTYDHSERLQPKRAPDVLGIPQFGGSYRGPYLDMARAAARRHGIPEDLFLRLVQQESGWNAQARSHKGAIGLAQLMPATARGLGVNPNDPAQNLDGGARYLRAQYNRFRSWRLALAAYNAGPEAVARHDGIPPYKETQGYVRAILGSG
ncbi:MAG: lytic transglycosylase domain-containing protein [Pseudomonadota bacterium]